MTEYRPGLERIQVAATLRRMRENAEVTRERAADELGCTVSKIGDIETGRSGVRLAELERLLDLYAVDGNERHALVETARAARRRRPRMPRTAEIPVGHRRFVDLEAQATFAGYYSPELIPGPLQTPAYARALLEWANWYDRPAVERRLALRMERASILTRSRPAPIAYWCILGEPALRSGVGGPAVMGEQLAHLVECANSLENLVIQVLPSGSGPHAFMGMTITLFRFAPPAPTVLHVEAPDQDRFTDREGEVASASHSFELLKAKALGREESLDLVGRLARTDRRKGRDA